MKFLNIRMKVTLWYAFFMLILISISLLFITYFSTKASGVNQKENLIESVTDAIKDFHSPGDFNYYENGICLIIYDQNQAYLEGIIPEGFSVLQPLQNDNVQSIEANNELFYIYDKKFDQTGQEYWMRGVVEQSGPDPIGTFTVYFATGFLPVFVVFTCIIGYFITKRAFRPVRRIQETAQNITDSNELSLRIGLPEGKDEIARLGQTVDQMLERLERSFEQEKQFTADVSHELRTPLAVILTESEYSLQHAESVEDYAESMEAVNRQANRMSTLINQLLFFSRSDNGSITLASENFDICPVLTELSEDYGSLAEISGINLSVKYNLPVKTIITGDKLLFTRCVSNIIQNAIKYSTEKGSIEIAISQEGDFVAIAVKDHGIGIAPADLNKIWNRFFQVETSRTKKNGESMGLGLSMVKTIVEIHHGRITVDSIPGEGSTFTLYFKNVQS